MRRYSKASDPVIQHAVGHGPQRGMMREAIKLLTDDTALWGVKADYKVPLLWPLPTVQMSMRKRDFWVCGSLAAIHMFALGMAPDPIAPWWILAIVYGDNTCMDLEFAFIEALDPDSAKILKPWFHFSCLDILATPAFEDPVFLLLVHYLGMIDVCSTSNLSLYTLKVCY
jgi:hypothetical protein